MSKDDSDDKGKVIDITDYQEKDDEFYIDNEEISNYFINTLNDALVQKQRQKAKESFVHTMINLLMILQFINFIVLAVIIIKIY